MDASWRDWASLPRGILRFFRDNFETQRIILSLSSDVVRLATKSTIAVTVTNPVTIWRRDGSKCYDGIGSASNC